MSKLLFLFLFFLVSGGVCADTNCEADLNGDGICDPYSIVYPVGGGDLSKITINIGGMDKSVVGEFELGDGGLVAGYIPNGFSLFIDFYSRNINLTKFDFRWNAALKDWVLFKKSTWVEPNRDESYSLNGEPIPDEAKFPQQFEVQRVECCIEFSQFSAREPIAKAMSDNARLLEIRSDFKYIEEGLSEGEKGRLFYSKDGSGSVVKKNVPVELVYEMTLILGADNVRSMNDYAYYLYQNKNYVPAAMLLKEIHKQFPDRVVAILNLADVYWELGMKSSACPLYVSYLEKMASMGKFSRIPASAKSRASCK